jgi:hypothetical protein
MANTEVDCLELRIDVRDPELTHAYALYKCLNGEFCLGIDGWHHKVFPASMSMLDIVNAWASGTERPMEWDMGNPIN